MAKNHNSRYSLFELIFLAFSSLILVCLLIASSLRESRIYDEITYVRAGYGFLTQQDFRLDPFNPPFAREIVALPALVNPILMDDPVLFWPRMTVVVFSVALLILIYMFARQLFGNQAALLAGVLYVFEPNLLTHGHYATMDMIFTFFYVLTIYLFFLWRHSFHTKRIIVLGVVLGLTLSTKISSVTLLLMPLLLLFVMTERKKRHLISKKYWVLRYKRTLLLIGVTLVSLWGTYFFTLEPFLGYRFDPNRPALQLAKENPLIRIGLTVPVPLGSYISTMKTILLFNYTDWYSKHSMFFQDIRKDGFFGYYFLPLLLIKLPIPLLLLFGSSLILMRKQQKKIFYLLVPVAAIFAGILLSKVMLVTRYVLPVIPFVIILSAGIASIHTKRKNMVLTIVVFLLFWQAIGTLRFFPHFVSYVNEIGGGTKNGYKVVFDANYDWGQGLIALKKYQAEHDMRTLQLAYFGDLNPSILGLQYERIKDLNLHEKKQLSPLKYDRKHTIAISTTCWYLCGYYKDEVLKDEKPVSIIGGSILLFEK